MVGASYNTGQGLHRVPGSTSMKERFDDTVEAVIESFRAVTIGDPWDDDTFMGPLISAAHLDRVAGFVDRARADGAHVWSPADLSPMAWMVGTTTRPPSSSMQIRV